MQDKTNLVVKMGNELGLDYYYFYDSLDKAMKDYEANEGGMFSYLAIIDKAALYETYNKYQNIGEAIFHFIRENAGKGKYLLINIKD